MTKKGKIIRNGIEYSGGGGSVSNIVYLTQAEYNALPDTKLSDGVEYRITDAGVRGSAENVSYDNSTSGLDAKNVQEAVDKMNESLGNVTNAEYVTDGLTFNGCSYVQGGYAKIGKMVIVNIRIKPTLADANASPQFISGFPKVMFGGNIAVSSKNSNSKVLVSYMQAEGTICSGYDSNVTQDFSVTYLCE